jgi:hypothetical protein
MRAKAIIQADVDTVILWADTDRLVAVAYRDGQVKRSRPLEADTLTGAVAEVQEEFGISEGEVVHISGWNRVRAPRFSSGRWT